MNFTTNIKMFVTPKKACFLIPPSSIPFESSFIKQAFFGLKDMFRYSVAGTGHKVTHMYVLFLLSWKSAFGGHQKKESGNMWVALWLLFLIRD
ncbi:hypothetical protein GS399_19965 [Pedobacter sp. HMF7647]|uniref:Uncharacterized protein n=1 Tax=Hufsiella arboris TaxID=2695275 RepID=A0A7K1YGR8_9SPHI|nr:hypothetical protein [Hufsiella arboris]MXV53249.1 hypothetical protein [Hufsiella arboris]